MLFLFWRLGVRTCWQRTSWAASCLILHWLYNVVLCTQYFAWDDYLRCGSFLLFLFWRGGVGTCWQRTSWAASCLILQWLYNVVLCTQYFAWDDYLRCGSLLLLVGDLLAESWLLLAVIGGCCTIILHGHIMLVTLDLEDHVLMHSLQPKMLLQHFVIITGGFIDISKP